MGKLIAFEGVDGSGKGTQSALLIERLREAGKTVQLYSFPRYTFNVYGEMVGEFLAGKHGPVKAQSPYLVALLFAGDRAMARAALMEDLQNYDYVVCDRYVSSNIAHQVAHAPERADDLKSWIGAVEYGCNRLPRPNQTIYLDMPLAHAQALIAKKAKRVYTDRAADEHEADSQYLQAVIDVYEDLCTSSEDGSSRSVWSRVVCVNPVTGILRSPEELAEEIHQRVVLLGL